MRPRFKPNIPAKSSRKSSSTDISNVTTEKADSCVEDCTNEVPNNVPFIPPNSSKTTENDVCEDVMTIEDISTEVIIESAVPKQIQKETITAITTKDSSKPTKSSATRRSRIKPNVTPAARKRNSSNKTDENDGNTEEFQCSAETLVEKDLDKNTSTVTTTTAKEPQLQKQQEKHQKESENKLSKTVEVAINVETKTPPQKTTTQPLTSTAGTSEDGKTQASSSSLSRRRRATPKICIPPRKKRTNSISSENVEKSDVQMENELQQGDADTEKEIPENSELPSKRPRLQSEAVDDDISVIEITVQTGEQDNSIEDEEHDNVEEEQTPTNKKTQGKGRKKRAPIRKPKEMLDPSKMTLQDLIYFNPKENFMKSSTDGKHKRLEQKRQSSQSFDNGDSVMDVDEPNTENQSNNQQTTSKTEEDGEGGEGGEDGESGEGGEGGDSSVSCAPQVKIGADGSIIVDEESLLIRSPTNSTLEDTEIIYEDANDVTYNVYGKGGIRRSRWSMPETLKFYKALSQVGTDFQLMVPLFPSRSRKELKAKFKKEEKTSYDLVDRALVHRTPISLEMFLKPEKDDTKNTKKKRKKQTANETEEQTEKELEITIDSS